MSESKILESLLVEVKQLLIKETTIQKEMTKRGENYNIFKTLGLSRKETRLHSSFIAELLDPYGAHGLNDLFLKTFISMNIEDEGFFFNSLKANVNIESYIGPKTDSSGGRIDIIIKDDLNNAIIIENKIDADDQENQLLRYSNYAKHTFSTYKLLYLTKEGYEASEFSIGKEQFAYNCISYRQNILNWLKRCSELSYNQPLVRETIKQYIINLKDILNIMSETYEDKFLEILVNKKYIKETIKIIENTNQIANKIRGIFIDQLIEIAKRYNLEVDNSDNIASYVKNSWIYFYPKNSRWAICVGNYGLGGNNGYLYGISYREGNKIDNNTSKRIKVKDESIFDEKANEDFPLGFSYFWGNGGKSKGGRWWKWDDPQTLLDMYNVRISQYLDENLFKPVVDGEWIEKLQEIEKDSNSII